MSLRRLMSQPCTVKRFGTTVNAYGDTVRGAATTATVLGWVTQRASGELLGQRTGEVSDWLAYLPAGTTIGAGDQLVHDGTTFEVDGPPLRARTPRGEHHIEVRLRLVEG